MEILDKYVSGAKEKVQNIMQGSGAAKEIRQGIAELEALPEIEGSILYTMELQSAFSYLRNLLYIIEDKRIDDPSVAEEIRRVMEKVQPAEEVQPAADTEAADVPDEGSDEEQAIDKVKNIVYNACVKALETLTA